MYVIHDDNKYPFSKGILAKSLYQSGVPLEEAYEIVRVIADDLEGEVDSVKASRLKEMASEELIRGGWRKEERYYRLRETLTEIKRPMFILIGGGPGVGKTTLATEVGRRLGIERIIGSDTVREIMRGILSRDLVPTLHESTFKAMDSLKTPYVTDKLIYAFNDQVNLVNRGLSSVVERGRKEGLDMILDGVHIVPGFLDSTLVKQPKYMFKYVIDVPDIEAHKRHFFTREKGSLRDPRRYIDNFERIRRIHEYILEVARGSGVTILENADLTEAIDEIVTDIYSRLDVEENVI
ncbi:MAG: 2-phosphoglycerate kinase [Candidatus Acetothermia bacterium]